MEKLEASKKKIIAIIPARGGSKSIKDKNLIKLKKKTLIQRSFIAIKNSKLIDKIVCSTEDIKIKNHCKKIGLDVVKRPKKLAKDNSKVFDTVKNVLDYYKKKKLFFDIVILVQPTSPFLGQHEIKLTIKKMMKNKTLSCQTIHETPHNYHYLNTRILKNNKIYFKFKTMRLKKFNKQKKEKTFHFGNLVATKTKALLKTKNFFCEPSDYVKIDRLNSFDLDDKKDLNYLERIRY